MSSQTGSQQNLWSILLSLLGGGAIGGGLGTEGGRNFLFGQQGMQKIDTLNKDQQQFLSQLFQNLGGSGGLGQGYGESTDLLRQLMDPSSEAVAQFTDPYMRQFEQQTVPGLAERFAGMGAQGGGLSSSGFGQSLSAAGGNLQSQLAALKAGLGQQAAGQLMGQYGQMSQLGLGTPAFGYQKPQQGALPAMFSAWSGSGFPGLPGF